MAITLESLKSEPDVRSLLAGPFDFALDYSSAEPDWFEIEGGDSLNVVARDAAGGVFLLVGPDDHLAYVSSDGRAGVIAASFADGLTMMIALPYWRDILRQSRGEPARMRRAVPKLEEAAKDEEPELDNYRYFLRSTLALAKPADPVASLNHAVKVLGKGFAVRATKDGAAFGALFD